MYSDWPSIIFHLFGVIASIGLGSATRDLNIKSENQALFLQGMHNFCIYYFFNWLSDDNYA